ncbi:hypothetical protein PR048_018380 [Dryococelus australis]|uniref:DUF4371 domain-containing protein n=1 Tax=Dryococelus australis TaxID=614101 RepID=A0ABQ9HC99_9NEOP|nr:hypothetical protein PR048_018380 [Dryococelus australis]
MEHVAEEDVCGTPTISSHTIISYNQLQPDSVSASDSGNKVPDLVMLDTRAKQLIESNKQKLIPIVEAIIFRDIALRGYQNKSGGRFDENNDSEINDGNFRSLLRFRIDSDDATLKDRIQNTPKKATFTNMTYQNDLIECYEATDLCHSEQMSISIRYVDLESHPHLVREDLIKFVKVIDLTGKSLSNTIIGVLEKLGLSLDDLRGQGYDGGSNMSGAFKGAQSYVRVLQPLATYVQCYRHCLNLALVKACGSQVQSLRSMIGIVEETTNFARDSPKRLELLKKKAQDHCPDVTGDTLLPLSKTRWVERHEDFLRFKDLLPAASGLYYSIMNFQYILALYVVVHVMKCTLPLLRQLQSPKLDIGQAEDMTQAIVLAIKKYRNEENFSSIFKESVKIFF